MPIRHGGQWRRPMRCLAMTRDREVRVPTTYKQSTMHPEGPNKRRRVALPVDLQRRI